MATYWDDNFQPTEALYQAAVPTATPVLTPASEIAALYQQYAGRAPDAGGAAWWQQQFGDTVDAAEADLFARSIAAARNEGTEPAAAPNPAVLYAPSPAPAPAPASPSSVTELYQQILGRAPETQAVVDMWTGLLGSTIEPADIERFMQGAQPELDRTAAANPVQTSLKRQILAQGTTENWSGEGFGTIEANADAMASILAQTGITDIRQFGQLPDGSYGNLSTGQAVPNTYGERQKGNAWGGTYAGEGNTGFRVEFSPDGTPVFYTNPQSSNTIAGYLENPLVNFAANAAAAYFGGPLGTGALQLAQGNSIGDAAKAALLAYGGQQLSGALGGGSSGVSTATDASFAAADAAQLAAQGIGEAQIASTLASSGMSSAAANLAASMAVNGLDVATMTQQLDALSTNTGLMSQTDNPAGFASADALQLQGQVGNNFASIEQNLIASGVDPLIAADISQQIAFNPNITQAELEAALNKSYGGNIYDVNMATTYPTSVLPGAGGLLSQVPGGATTAAPAASTGTSGLTTDQITNIIKAGASLAGVGAAGGLLSQGGGATTPLQAPTQGMPSYGPEYYNQLQQYYNTYMPQAPRDVVGPLQQWYNSSKA